MSGLVSIKEVISSVPYGVVVEASVTITSVIAGTRRLAPKLDGWWVFGYAVVLSLLAGFGTYGLEPKSMVLAVWAFITAYGGYNVIRKLFQSLVEYAIKLQHSLREGSALPSIPAPPSFPEQKEEKLEGPP